MVHDFICVFSHLVLILSYVHITAIEGQRCVLARCDGNGDELGIADDVVDDGKADDGPDCDNVDDEDEDDDDDDGGGDAAASGSKHAHSIAVVTVGG